MNTAPAFHSPPAPLPENTPSPTLQTKEPAHHPGGQRAGVYGLRFLAGTFLALSILDFYLTWLLVGKWIVATEANPVAAKVLAHAGWGGLLLFKGFTAVMVVVLIQQVARYNLRSARGLFWAGVVVMSLVVGYSGFQVLANVDALARLALHTNRKKSLHERERLMRQFSRQTDEMADKVLRGELSLHRAVEKLAHISSQTSPRGADYLRPGVYTHLDENATLAAVLISRVGRRVQHDPALATELFHSLTAEFRRYHHTVPWCCQMAFFPNKIPYPFEDGYAEPKGQEPPPRGSWFITYRDRN